MSETKDDPYSWPSDSDEPTYRVAAQSHQQSSPQSQPRLRDSGVTSAAEEQTLDPSSLHASFQPSRNRLAAHSGEPVNSQQHTSGLNSGTGCSSIDGVCINCSKAEVSANADSSKGSPDGWTPAADVDKRQPGGGRPQPDQRHLDPAAAPAGLRAQQLAATVEGYRAATYTYGIPYRCAHPTWITSLPSAHSMKPFVHSCNGTFDAARPLFCVVSSPAQRQGVGLLRILFRSLHRHV